MRQVCAAALTCVIVLAACGGDDATDSASATTTTTEATTTTRTPTSTAPAAGAGCGISNFGQPHDEPEECWQPLLEHVLAGDGVSVDGDAADGQAKSLCIRMDGDAVGGLLSMLADWETGVVTPPTEDPADRSQFMAAAVGIYCPEHWDLLIGLNE